MQYVDLTASTGDHPSRIPTQAESLSASRSRDSEEIVNMTLDEVYPDHTSVLGKTNLPTPLLPNPTAQQMKADNLNIILV